MVAKRALVSTRKRLPERAICTQTEDTAMFSAIRRGACFPLIFSVAAFAQSDRSR